MAESAIKEAIDKTVLMDPSDWQKLDGPLLPGGGAYFYFIKCMGDLKGKRILDAGCGDGWLSVILAKRGALSVNGIDVSSEAIDIARARAKANNVVDQVSFQVGPFENMAYEDDYFDLVVGSAILHHVDIDNIVDPVQRVLKKGGEALFMECFGNSMWLERLRLLVPIPVSDTDRSNWQRQIKYSDITKFEHAFGMVKYREFELFSRLDRLVKNRSIVLFLNRFDEALFGLIPALRRYARLVVIQLEQPHKTGWGK